MCDGRAAVVVLLVYRKVDVDSATGVLLLIPRFDLAYLRHEWKNPQPLGWSCQVLYTSI